MLIDLNEEECRTILSCIEIADMMYKDKQKDRIKALKKKINRGVAEAPQASAILKDMVRGYNG